MAFGNGINANAPATCPHPAEFQSATQQSNTLRYTVSIKTLS
jgi:hypothetical protein